MLEAGSFEEYLWPVAAGVSPRLISPSAFSDISSVARVLPSTLAYNTFGFECRLGEELPRADFLVLATASCGRDSLAGLHPTSTLPAPLMADPVWRRVRDFAARWAEPSSPLYHAVDNVWLEFDIDGPVPDVPVPSVFFGLPTNVQTDATHEPDVDRYRATAETPIRLLSGDEPPPRMLETLSSCFRALSPDEQVFQVGLMLSRGADAVRLCIRLRSVERIVEYLAGVGWPGDEAGLRGVLDPLARSVDRVMLDIDVGETVGAKIGLECYFDGNRQPRARAQVGRLLGFPCPARPVYGRQTRSAAGVSRLRRPERAWRALAGGASAGFATARRALVEHLRAFAPPRQDRVPAGRAARGQGLPGRQPLLAHARLQILVGPATGKERHDLSSPEEQPVSLGEKAW